MILFLYLLGIAPKLLFDYWVRGKKHPGIANRFGFGLPITEKSVIWIHAVSVGEVKSAKPLFLEMKKLHPEAFFFITTTTATGGEEARRSLPEADAFSYLPLDFKWVVRRFVGRLKPKLFLLVETDFWPNLLRALKKKGCKNVLVSGKLSKKSARRFHFFSFFARRLFSQLDHLCVQNEEYYRRFQGLVDSSKLHITGNLKLDMAPQRVALEFWKARFQSLQPIVTLSCTHASEEEMLLDALEGLPCSIFLVPRHPERFVEVAGLLERKKIPFASWSRIERDPERVILVDSMGQLPICYSLSHLCVVGGSFVPIGGHNVLEPCLYGTPVFFGPHMFLQTELSSLVTRAGAGKQVALEKLREEVRRVLNQPEEAEGMRKAASDLVEMSRGSASRTLPYLN